MRIALIALLAGCAMIPEPRGPRTVCNSSAIATGNYATGYGECEQVPADRCWNDYSPECQSEREARAAHNDGVRSSSITALVVLGVIAAATVVTLAVTCGADCGK